MTTSRDLDFSKSFSDSRDGFSFYTLGQLRNGSDSMGYKYGERMAKDGRVGVLIDISKGQIQLFLNGKNFGLAFESDQLKKGPIYPAISLREDTKIKFLKESNLPQDFL